MMLLAKSVSAREIISILSTQLQIQHHLLVDSMRDCASVNVAMHSVRVLYPKVFHIGCLTSLFSRSPKNKLAWKSQTDRAIRTYSVTRWWSRWEAMKQIHDLFGDVERFVTTADLSPAAKVKLQSITNHPNQKSITAHGRA